MRTFAFCCRDAVGTIYVTTNDLIMLPEYVVNQILWDRWRSIPVFNFFYDVCFMSNFQQHILRRNE